MALNPYSKWGGTNQANAPNSLYVYGSAKNVPFLGSPEGTPFVEDLVNDLWGFFQRMLTRASITPSGNPDHVLASDYYNAMQAVSGYPGTVVPLALNDTPANHGLRILLLDGSGIVAVNYPDLVTNTYVGDPANATALSLYRADDAAGTSRNTSGAYFILPDARGRFIRGIDSGGAVDPGGTRLPGHEQNWAAFSHYHNVRSASGGTPYGSASFDASILIPSASNMLLESATPDILEAQSMTTTGGAPIANLSTDETRPVNIAFDLGIWY